MDIQARKEFPAISDSFVFHAVVFRPNGSKLTVGRYDETIYIYENIPGGVGLTEKLYSEFDNLLEASLRHMRTCACIDGCPTCIGPPMETGNCGKDAITKLIEYMLAVAPV